MNIMDERGFPDETLDELFAQPAMTQEILEDGEKRERTQAVAREFNRFARHLRDHLVVSADRTDAIRKLRELRALALEAIRLEDVRR